VEGRPQDRLGAIWQDRLAMDHKKTAKKQTKGCCHVPLRPYVPPPIGTGMTDLLLYRSSIRKPGAGGREAFNRTLVQPTPSERPHRPSRIIWVLVRIVFRHGSCQLHRPSVFHFLKSEVSSPISGARTVMELTKHANSDRGDETSRRDVLITPRGKLRTKHHGQNTRDRR